MARAPKRDGPMCWGDVLGKVKGEYVVLGRLGRSFLLRESFVQSQMSIVLPYQYRPNARRSKSRRR